MKEIFWEPYRSMIGKLKKARLRRGWTQRQVAARIGKGRSWVGKVEQAEIRLDLVHFLVLCRVYRLNWRKVMAELALGIEQEQGPGG